MDGFEEREDEEERESSGGYGGIKRTMSLGCEAGTRENIGLLGVLVGGGAGGGGGKICGGNGGSDGGDSNRGSASTDMHYQKMIQADPGNPLLLSNYTRFLKEVNFSKFFYTEKLQFLWFD